MTLPAVTVGTVRRIWLAGSATVLVLLTATVLCNVIAAEAVFTRVMVRRIASIAAFGPLHPVRVVAAPRIMELVERAKLPFTVPHPFSSGTPGAVSFPGLLRYELRLDLSSRGTRSSVPLLFTSFAADRIRTDTTGPPRHVESCRHGRLSIYRRSGGRSIGRKSSGTADDPRRRSFCYGKVTAVTQRRQPVGFPSCEDPPGAIRVPLRFSCG